MQFSSSLHTHGFTLIELLVTVAIMITVLGGGLVGYIGFNQRQVVLESAKRTQSLFRAARAKAQVRDTPAGCATAGPPATALYGYSVSAETTTPGSVVELRATCGTSQAAATAHATVSDSFVLPSGVSLSQTFAVTYYTLHGGTNLASDTVIALTDGTRTYQFTVTPGGELTDGCWEGKTCE